MDEDPILLAAGSADVRFQEPGLEFDVSLEGSGGNVHVDVRLTNRNDVPVPLVWGGCALHVVLYDDAARSNFAADFPIGCFNYLTGGTLEPGESRPPG